MIFQNAFILLYLYLYLQICFVDGAGKSSIAFVIDDTGSMSNEIQQVKEKTLEVFDAVLTSNGSAIDDFVLVTFNDPGTQLRIVTKDKYAYKTQVDSIQVNGGDDCEELAMAGIELALENSKPNSLIYVFTDASAKDYDKFERVKSLSQKKSSQVTFLLTGLCNGGTEAQDYVVFEKLAEATSGQIFNIEKHDVNKIIDYIIQSIKHKKTTLGKKTIRSSDEIKNVTFSVDSKIWDVIVSVSADNPEFRIFGPEHDEVTVERITATGTTSIGKLKTKPGNYTIVLNKDSRSPKSVVITGSTSVTFQHGFSPFRPSTIHETSAKPIPDQPSFLSIELENNNRDVVLKTVEFRDENDNFINELPLEIVNDEQQFYTTEAFYPPTVTFKILIHGYSPSNKRITRLSPTTVEYQKPDLVGEPLNSAPKVTILEEDTVNAEYKKPLTIHCKVIAYPKPDVFWHNDNGAYLTSTVSAVDLPYDYMSILHLAKVEANGIVTCIANNTIGQDKVSAKIQINTFFNVLEYPSNMTIEYGTTKQLKLNTESFPNVTIVWYKDDEVIRRNSEDFTISHDNSTLTIKYMQPDLRGNYTVQASNGVNANRFDFKIGISGTDPPVVEIDDTHRVVRAGELTQITCLVDGVPNPTVRWLIDGLEINTSKKYKIYKDNTLSFRSSVDDSGVYTCEASNPLGKTRKDVRLDIFVPVNIESPKRSIIELKVGDPLILPCNADGFPKPNINWMFFSKDAKTAPKSIRNDITNSVVVERVQISDDGLYTCVASNPKSLSNITYEVNVNAPPTIFNTLQDKTIVAVKGDLVLRLPCKVQGRPKPTVTWTFKNGLNIATGTEWYDVDKDGTLIIKHIDENDAGDYICKAENPLGSSFEKYKVIVLDSLTPAGNNDTILMLEEGKSFGMNCEIPHRKSDLVRWFKDGRFIKDGDLNLSNVKTADSGLYSCRVSNFKVSHSAHYRVMVGSKPTFTTDEDTDIDFVEGYITALSCDASGEPKPKIEWWKNNQPIEEPSMTHYILSMETSDIGQYRCRVSNKFGTISRTFHIICAKECIDKIFEKFYTYRRLHE